MPPTPEIEGVEVVRRPALTVSPTDMLEADGYLLGTPANLGYMSGALKHAFDVCYYPLPRRDPGPAVRRSTCTATRAPRAPNGRVAAHHDRAGLGEGRRARRGRRGKPTKADLEACWDLGATVAAR